VIASTTAGGLGTWSNAGMDLSCNLYPHPDTVAHVELAESLGYARAWLFDSPAIYDDVWMTLALAADHTQRIGLGPAVIVPSLRNVVTNAAAVATLERLAPGRAAVAIGTGFSGRMLLGRGPLPWRDVEDYVAALRGLLRGETVTVDGKRVRLCQPWLDFPVPTPVLVGANGPKGLEVARKHADGIITMIEPVGDFAWCVSASAGTILEPDESPTSERVVEAVAALIGYAYHATYEAGGAAVDDLPGGRAWREAIETVPEDERHIAVHERHLISATDRERPLLSPDLVAMTSPLTGTPEQVRERVAGFAATGMTELAYTPMGPDIPRELRAMAAALS
jgi:5,10-methylenetetrahydromethanopterin reductase